MTQKNLFETKFILFLNGKPAAHFDSSFDARKQLHYVKKQMPGVSAEIRKEVCRMEPVEDLNDSVTETIRKVKGGYRLVSKSGKNLGTYPSKSGAENRERQVQYFKHINENNGPGEEDGDEDGFGFMESHDRIDTVTFDVPTFIRALEYAHEDAKSDEEMHAATERLLKLSKTHSVITMDLYDEIFGRIKPVTPVAPIRPELPRKKDDINPKKKDNTDFFDIYRDELKKNGVFKSVGESRSTKK